MANKKLFWGMPVLVLTFSFLIGCTSAPKAPKEPPVALGLTLEEALQRYMGPQPQNWGGKIVPVYFLDPLRFDAFKAELDAGSEYSQVGAWTETRDWWQGKFFARWAKEPDGRFRLELGNEDNSLLGYRYAKRKSSTPGLEENLARYTVPMVEDWDGDMVSVYFLDPLMFDEFKVELDAWVGYYEAGSWENNRDWDRGLTFARWIVKPDGSFQLELGRKNNVTLGYEYKKIRQTGETWDEEWDEGTITLTYLGLDVPAGFELEHEGEGRGQYQGYYTFYYHAEGKRRYVYYPTTGRNGVQYSKWLN